MTSTHIAKTIGKKNLHSSQIGTFLKFLQIKGNTNFHHLFEISDIAIANPD